MSHLKKLRSLAKQFAGSRVKVVTEQKEVIEGLLLPAEEGQKFLRERIAYPFSNSQFDGLFIFTGTKVSFIALDSVETLDVCF